MPLPIRTGIMSYPLAVKAVHNEKFALFKGQHFLEDGFEPCKDIKTFRCVIWWLPAKVPKWTSKQGSKCNGEQSV